MVGSDKAVVQSPDTSFAAIVTFFEIMQADNKERKREHTNRLINKTWTS